MDNSLINISENYKKHSERQLSKYGESFKAIGLSPRSQQQRFEILSDIGDLRNKNILDVGCGFGDFYIYLMENFQIHDYIVIDISPGMIEIARKKNPNILFYHNDILNKFLAYCNMKYEHNRIDNIFVVDKKYVFKCFPETNIIELLYNRDKKVTYDLGNFYTDYCKQKIHKKFLYFLRRRYGLILRTKY